jgi:hypothetical protein
MKSGSLLTTSRNEKVWKEGAKSSSPGEFHPQALTDPDVTVSRHPARITHTVGFESNGLALPALAPPISGWPNNKAR